jgi:hypothetical protein
MCGAGEMRRWLIVPIMLLVIPAWAVPAWLIGFGVGVTVQIIPFTRNKVIMPPLRKMQRTIRPIPQDKVDAANHRAEKARRKAQRAQRKAEGR